MYTFDINSVMCTLFVSYFILIPVWPSVARIAAGRGTFPSYYVRQLYTAFVSTLLDAGRPTILYMHPYARACVSKYCKSSLNKSCYLLLVGRHTEHICNLTHFFVMCLEVVATSLLLVILCTLDCVESLCRT